jgi:hypothetical protein
MESKRDNMSLGCAGLLEGTGANTFKITNTVNVLIAGRSYQKPATDSLPFTAGHTSLAAKQTCAFFVHIDTALAVTTTQSAIVSNSQAQGYVKGAWEWPAEVAGKACIGAIVVDCQNAAVFVPNTTDLGATDVVDTYHNVAHDYGVPIGY